MGWCAGFSTLMKGVRSTLDCEDLLTSPPHHYPRAVTRLIMPGLFHSDPTCSVDATCFPEMKENMRAVVQLSHPAKRNFCSGTGGGDGEGCICRSAARSPDRSAWPVMQAR